MTKTLIIAEKPSVANDIAKTLGGFTKHDEYFESEQYVLSSAVGHLLEIAVPDESIVERMDGRRSHPGSGRVYHVKFNPPKVDGVDDITGEPLIQRDDDKAETVKKRLDVYHNQTEVLLAYYNDWAKSGTPGAPKYRRIDGLGPVEQIRDSAFAALAS